MRVLFWTVLPQHTAFSCFPVYNSGSMQQVAAMLITFARLWCYVSCLSPLLQIYGSEEYA